MCEIGTLVAPVLAAMKLMLKLQVFDDKGPTVTHAFTRFPVHIGRDKDCELRVRHRRASRRHARIERVEDALVLVDEGSRNGVFRNDARVNPVHPVRLRDGDRLAMGPISVTVGISELTEPVRLGPNAADGVAKVGPQAMSRTTQLSNLASDVAFRAPIAALPPRRTPAQGVAELPEDLPRIVPSRGRETRSAKRPSVDLRLDGFLRVIRAPTSPRAPEQPAQRGWIAGIWSAAVRRVEAAVRYLGWLLGG
jgi:predicted component of type VI protein secretion system